MQTEYTGYIDRAEWRWVTFVSLGILLFVFAPFMLLAIKNPSQSNAQFMGALHNQQDSAADLAEMAQGADGQILVQFLYTADEHNSSLIQPIYPLLGRIAAFTGQSSINIYHIVRIFSALFMYLTIYHLGASIWVKVRTRRVFFILASIGSGLGWLVALGFGFSKGVVIPDLMIPQAYPIYANAANVHYPLTIACLALIASVLIPVLRPGAANQPTAENGAGSVFVASMILAFIYPDALLPLGVAFVICVGVYWYSRKRISPHEWQWGLWLLVPALPIVTYDIIILMNNDVVAGWLKQRANVPSIPMLLIGLGLPLIIALPGLWRAFRRFEADGDRFMLLWLLSMIILMYLPLELKQYLLVGLMLPLAYFATRSVEDFWFNYVKRRYRIWVYVIFIPLIILSHIFWLFLPVMPAIRGWGLSEGLLEKDYAGALIWLDSHAKQEDVILASPTVSLWIPPWTDSHTVYGHFAETLNAATRLEEVQAWYQAKTSSDEICDSLIKRFSVDYVLLGPRENASACFDNLTAIAFSDTVTIYTTHHLSLP